MKGSTRDVLRIFFAYLNLGLKNVYRDFAHTQQAFQTHAMVPDNIAMVEQTMRRAQSALEVSLAPGIMDI